MTDDTSRRAELPAWRRWLGRRLRSQARTLLLTVPLHLLAFLVLYLATARIMESELLSIASDAAAGRLEQIAVELSELALVHPGDAEAGHDFRALIAAHWDARLQLLRPGGGLIGMAGSLSDGEHRDVVDFMRGDDGERLWMSSAGGRDNLRGLRRVTAGESCLPCHQPSETLAVAAMTLDLTTMLARVRGTSRRNLGLLIVAWAALLGLINVIVRRSVKRSAAKLEAQLEAAESGESGRGGSPTDLVLEPGSARLHEAFSQFLERQRRRREDLASRLEHTDQLASLGRLAAGLAHEIKNPLAGIQGALEILREDGPEEQTAMLYDDMLDELKRVNTTLQLLLESARPSPPRLALADPGSLVKETVYLLRPGLRRSEVSVRYEVAPGIGPVRIDAAKIRQVLINLIQNAAEAMDGEGSITVRAGAFPEEEGGLILAVEDDGPGIAPEAQARIFEPFFTTKFAGTGLGLAISKRLVEQHGGTLQVDSERGRGTTFYVLLPSEPPEEAGALDSGEALGA